jgi:hypothetical protein
MKSGHIYRRELDNGRMGKWHAVIDLPRGQDGKRRQKTKSFDTEDEAIEWIRSINDPSSPQHWHYMAPPKPSSDLRFSKVNVDRFFSKICIDESGCWLWTGPLAAGYAQFYIAGSQLKVPAHRWSYEYWTDQSIPPGMTLDHICHQPQECRGGPSCVHRSCQNPEHLKIETPLENAARRSPNRGWAPEKKWTHCIRGHEFTEETTRTYVRKNGKTARTCQICHKIRAEKK